MMTPAQNPIEVLLQRANDALREGQPAEAASLYQQVLTLAPHIAAVHFNLGNTLMALDRRQDAVACYRESIRLDPGLAVAHGNLGFALARAGQLSEAIDCYCRVVILEPKNLVAISDLANALSDAGFLDEGISLYRRALELQPDHFAACNNLGNALCKCGKLDEAIECFLRALQLVPDSAVTLCNLGVALQSQKRYDDAIVCYCKAIELNPDHAKAFCNLGDVLKSQGNSEQAIACFRRAVELECDLFEAHRGLGELLFAQGKLDDAVHCLQRAVELKPDSVEANHSLGNAFKEDGQIGLAIACYERVLELDSQYAGAYCNLGVAMLNQGRVDEAMAYFQQALRLLPDYRIAHNNLLYSMQYREGVSLADLAESHRSFDERHAMHVRPDVCSRRIDSVAHRPLRIGFVSADFGRHPTGYFLTSTLDHLARNEFETFCFSDRVRVDDMTLRLRSAAARWHDVRLLEDDQLTQLIRQEQIDILFDLSGHTSGNRLMTFARRAAPIQITWAGYVGTTGLKQMDFILADRFEIPVESERYYEERVLRMPDGYVCYTPPVMAPNVVPLPALSTGKLRFGCFNNPAKLSQRIIDTWLKILLRVPESQLILKYKGWNDQTVVQQFTERFAHAIDPSRIIFMGKSSHLEMLAEYNRVDITLDPSPYSGGLTTCEALWMGVPVVTCPGETFASRHSLSHLSNIGLTETIAHDLDDYVERTIALATNLPHLAELRAGLRDRMAASPLCDGRRFAKNLGKLLQRVWNEYHVESDRAVA